MRILYYDWDEFNGEDCRDAMRRLGHEVETFRNRENFGKRDFDCVFSFDYYPEIAEKCHEQGITYISWVFDCPHYPLYSNTIFYEENRIHIFDKKLCEELKAQGAKHVYHTPLGVNEERLKSLALAEVPESYMHDVTFLGNLYDNEFNFFDQATFPDDLKEYLSDVIDAQQLIYGKDIISDKRVIDDSLMEVLRSYIRFEDTGKYNVDYDRVILDIIRKKVTVTERRKILEALGDCFDTTLYTTPDAKLVPGVTNLGLADYNAQMPYIFHNSKININMTFRCIPSGIPLRVMDVLGSGGFLITTYQDEIAEYFEENKDLVIVRTPDEFIEKTAYYLEHEEERKEIAVNGQKKVYEKFAYTKLLPEVLTIV